MLYRPTRDENDQTIKVLADRYPKAFFEDPKLRRPLRKNIVADLQKDGFPAAHELIAAAVDWYKSHFGYQYALRAGAKCLDLNGKEVATVTDTEAKAAQKYIRDCKEKENERLAQPVARIVGKPTNVPKEPPMVKVAKPIDPRPGAETCSRGQSADLNRLTRKYRFNLLLDGQLAIENLFSKAVGKAFKAKTFHVKHRY